LSWRLDAIAFAGSDGVDCTMVLPDTFVCGADLRHAPRNISLAALAVAVDEDPLMRRLVSNYLGHNTSR
jgi:hypothetical protein